MPMPEYQLIVLASTHTCTVSPQNTHAGPQGLYTGCALRKLSQEEADAGLACVSDVIQIVLYRSSMVVMM